MRTPPNTASTRVYIDLDDVLCETALALSDLHYRIHDRRVAFEDIHSFNLWESFSLTQNEYENLMQLGHEDEFLFNIAPVSGWPDVIARWRDAGMHISIVTGRPPSTADVSEAWLDVNGAAYDDIIFVDKYGRGDPDQTACISLDELNKISFDIAIDDAPRMINHLLEHTPIPVIIFDRPWNSTLETFPPPNPGHPARAKTWPQLADQVLNKLSPRD